MIVLTELAGMMFSGLAVLVDLSSELRVFSSKGYDDLAACPLPRCPLEIHYLVIQPRFGFLSSEPYSFLALVC